MNLWPVPDSYSKDIPKAGKTGSFWEDRGDRFHCGIDIYAPKGSEVISIEDGIIIKTGIFTTSKKETYWNKTYYVVIKNISNFYYKYAELGDLKVKTNEMVKAGQIIGLVGKVLNLEKIKKDAPGYIQKLKKNQKQSMLHFELYNAILDESNKYLGGNWFGLTKPNSLLDSTDYILSL